MGGKESGATSKAIRENLQNLQDLVVRQASRLINNDLYTKSLLSSLPVALLSTDQNGLIQVANRAAEEMLQTELPSIKGSPLIDLFNLSPAIAEKITQAWDQKEPVSADSLELILADDEQRVVNIHVRQFQDEERRVFGTLLAMEDQTYLSFLRESFKQHALTPSDGEVVARSPKMKRIVKQLAELAKSDGPVLFSGESGSGKVFLAAKLHKDQGLDPQAPFIVLDCREIDGARSKETLFGSGERLPDDKQAIRFKSLHDYGTIHLAEGGTLVLRNIDALGLECLEAVNDYVTKAEKGFSTLPKCRIMAITEIDSVELGQREEFCKPLLDRLLQGHVLVPALRARRKDILSLARQFLADREGGDTKKFSRGAENGLLTKKYYQNNVKELKDAIELAVLVADGDTIRTEHIFTGPIEEAADHELDLTDYAPVRFLISDKTLSRLRGGILACCIALIMVILLFSDNVTGVIGNYLIWGVAAPFLMLLILLFGRISCTVCPLSTAGRMASRIWSFAKSPPEFIKNSSPFLIPVSAVFIAWSEHVFHMTTHPRATGFFLITLILIVVFFALLFERETWCRYCCPLGNFAGLFSLAAILFVRSNSNVCSTKCTTHNCHKGSDEYAACPVFHHPLYARNAHICKLCFNCLKSCPHGSARLYLRPPLVRIWQQLDIGGTIRFFALVCFFLAPCLLASKRIPFLIGNGTFTLAVLACLGLAAVGRYTLPTLLFQDHELKQLRTTRLVLALLLLAWGPFMAFEIAHLPGFDTLFIFTDQQSMLHAVLPEHGVPLLALAQLGVIWFGALMAAVTLLGMGWRVKRERTGIAGRNWYLVFGVCLFYPLLNSWIVL
jgi:transcriptional regulator of aromatic amino acid metabolism/polyferredoxin